MVGIGAPSIPLKALRLPPSSRIATFSLTPISLAFATAASTIFCASSEEMLCFFTTWAIAHLPSLDMYCLLFIPHFAHLRCPSLSCTITLPRWPFPLHRRLNLRSSLASGIHSAVHGKIRAGNVRGLRSGDKRHHRGDLIHTPVTIKRCGGLLRHRPITRGGIQFRVDRTGLHVVDRDAPAPDLSGQRLSEHLDGSLRARVWHKPGRRDTFTHGRTDHDDAAAALHVLQCRLSCHVDATDVDVEHAIHLFERRLLERFWNGRARVVHQHIQSTEGCKRLFNRGFNRVGIGGIRLNRDRFSASAFNLLDDGRGCVRTLRISDGHIRAIRRQTLRDGGTNAARPARYQCNLSVQFLRHCFSPAPRISLSLVAEIDCLVGCGSAPLATYFVKLAPMPCGHGRRNGATTSSIFCCDCGSGKYDGGRRAKAAHLTAIAEPTDP